jgi:hypothetical protein
LVFENVDVLPRLVEDEVPAAEDFVVNIVEDSFETCHDDFVVVVGEGGTVNVWEATPFTFLLFAHGDQGMIGFAVMSVVEDDDGALVVKVRHITEGWEDGLLRPIVGANLLLDKD